MSLRAEMTRVGARWFLRQRAHEPPEKTRQRLQAMETVTPRPPAGTVTTHVDAGGVPAARIAVPGGEPGRHVLFLHGGGYRAGAPSNYRHFTWRIAAAIRADVVALDYRLAPEQPFPAALEDTVSAYRWLLAQSVSPAAIVMMGDSAGGGLALAALLKIRDDGLPLPAACVATSPWTDLALTGASLRRHARKDPLLNADLLPSLAEDYLGGADPRLPYASPLYGELTGLPPTLIHVGADEILRDDAVRMHERLQLAGCRAELEVWPRMVHSWHLFVPMLPEAQRAIGRIGNFAQQHLMVARRETN